jgi:hypothetical protein
MHRTHVVQRTVEPTVSSPWKRWAAHAAKAMPGARAE